MTTLYVKRGRRYVAWGHLGERWPENDVMEVGTFRLVSCPEPGLHRYTTAVTPDIAGFVAAAEVAAHAMETAMNEAARATPQLGSTPYTPEQRRLIERFRSDMAAAGALVPSFWTHASARDIARAGIEAVRLAGQC